MSATLLVLLAIRNSSGIVDTGRLSRLVIAADVIGRNAGRRMGADVDPSDPELGLSLFMMQMCWGGMGIAVLGE
jgi:hypothetical protein